MTISQSTLDVTHVPYLLKQFLFILILGMVLTLPGCGKKEDLSAYINKIKSRPTDPLAALPKLLELPPPSSFKNDVHHSPFQPLREKILLHKKHKSVVREALEDYPVDTLKFVGTLRQEGRMYGLIMTRDAKVFLVQRGQKLDKNLAAVSRVGLKKIVVVWRLKSSITGKNKIMTLRLATHV